MHADVGRYVRHLLALTVIVSCTPRLGVAQSQDSVSTVPAAACDEWGFRALLSPTETRERAAQVAGTHVLQYWGFRREGERLSCSGGPAKTSEVRAMPVSMRVVERTGYAGGANDGSLWQGKGLSASVTSGIHARFRSLSAQISPELTYSQNQAFALRPVRPDGRSPYGSTFHRSSLDNPVRMGPDPFVRIFPGSSYLKLDLGPWTAGVSSQNLWMGPGLESSLLMSNNAPGFAHAFLGTGRPVSVGVGDVFVQLIGGRLSESAYFDTIPTNDHDAISILHVGFSPKLLPSLQFVATRVFVVNPARQKVGFRTFIDPVLQTFFKNGLATEDNPFGNSPDNQLASVGFRWVFPESGVEAYGEYGREDHSASLDDFLQEPDHSAAYVLGVQKVFVSPGRNFALGFESTSLQIRTPPRVERPLGQWYRHSVHGYTNRGELMGSYLGPGGKQSSAHADVFSKGDHGGLFIRRTTREAITRYGLAAQKPDLETSIGVLVGRRLGSNYFGASAEVSQRKNRLFLEDNMNAAVSLMVRGDWPNF